MRNIIFLLHVIVFSSCSKTVNCIDPKLIGAALANKDTSVYYVYRYTKGAKFTNPLDSVNYVLNHNNYYIYVSDNYDWKIVPDSGNTIYLQDITLYPKTKKGDTYIGWTGKEKETGCFNDVSYTINGTYKYKSSNYLTDHQHLD